MTSLAGESVRQGWRIISRGFRGAYDYMGMNMVLSSLWFFIGLAPAGLAFLVMLQLPSVASALIFGLVCTFILGPVTAGVYSMSTSMLLGEHVLIREFFRHLRDHYRRSAWATAALLIILAILLVDLAFFLRSETAWLQVLSIIWVYFLAFWALAAQCVYPLVVRKKRRTLETLKMAALLVLDNLVATLLLGLAGLVVTALCVLLQVPVVLFFAGTLSFLHVAALDELLLKYGQSDGGPSTSEGEALA